MAAPVKQRPGRYLVAVAGLIVALYLGVFLGPSPTPALGLDLRGGTEVTLTAQPLTGGSVTKSDLNQAVNIIRNRVNGLGVGGAEINTQGSTNIVVSVPGKSRKQVVDTVGQTALLRFRQVLHRRAVRPARHPDREPVLASRPQPGWHERQQRARRPRQRPPAVRVRRPRSHPKVTCSARRLLPHAKPSAATDAPPRPTSARP